VRPSSFGRGLPKNTYGGHFRTPRPKYIRRGTLPSLSHKPTNPQKPKTKLWSTDPHGAHMGGSFPTPILGPWASDPNPKKLVGAILGNPILGTTVTLALFFSIRLLSISEPPGPPSHYRYPTYRPQTHLSWGKP